MDRLQVRHGDPAVHRQTLKSGRFCRATRHRCLRKAAGTPVSGGGTAPGASYPVIPWGSATSSNTDDFAGCQPRDSRRLDHSPRDRGARSFERPRGTDACIYCDRARGGTSGVSAPYRRCASLHSCACLLSSPSSYGAHSQAGSKLLKGGVGVARSNAPRSSRTPVRQQTLLLQGLCASPATWMAHCCRCRTTIATVWRRASRTPTID